MSYDPFRDQMRGVLPPSRELAVRRLRDLIRVSISDGTAEHAPGGALIDEHALMVTFDAPRDTVRHALSLLVEEGLIVRRRGIGTTAGDQYQFSALLPPTGQTLESHHHVGRLSPLLLHWGWMKAPDSVASRLDDVETGDDCLCVDYVLLRDDEPSSVITNYLRADEATRLSVADFQTDFYQLLETTGPVASHDVVLQAANADEQVAALLHILPGEAVLWFEQVLRNAAGEAIDFAVATFRRETRIEFQAIPRLDVTALLQPAPGSMHEEAKP
ncbi:GntR family transcriptional regulator [Gryllotalpicola protaetiae]|nr:GntR family transcriptional regulator [Gryllotalpicola protaetiae]